MVAELVVTPSFPEAMTWPERARAIAISDQASYEAAAGLKLDLAALRKKIVEEFAPMKEAAHRAHKAITTKENEYLLPIEIAEKTLIGSLKTWANEQERLRRIEEARLQEEARAAAEADRLRREAEARVIREEAERAAAEIRARDEELRLAAACEAQASGATETAVAAILESPVIEVPVVAPLAAYIEPPVYIAPAIAAPTYNKVNGLGIRENWSALVVSMKDLCRAVADGTIPETYVSPNLTALNSRARSDKNLMRIPGVRAVKT